MKIYALVLGIIVCGCVSGESTNAVDVLKSIMSKDGASFLTQRKGEAGDEKGKLYWNAEKKRIRVEMNDGVIYLYTEDGVHIKDAEGLWTFVQVPSDWARMLLEPDVLIREKCVEIHKVNDTTHGLHLEEGGQFIDVFWTKDQLKGWIIGHMEQGMPYNDLSVDLEKAPVCKLSSDAWEPKSSFLDTK